MASLDPEKIMYFHLGGQKTGSSWLYRSAIVQHPEHVRGALKEYHYFSAIDNHIVRTGESLKLASKVAEQRVTDRVYAWKYPKPIVAVFNRFGILDYSSAIKGRNVGRFYSDFTPNYSAMSAEGFERMKSFHPNARYSLVMRDPVDRLWSSIFHAVKQRLKTSPNISIEERARIAAKASDNTNLMRLSEYDKVIDFLRDVDANHKLFFFYESFFNREQVDKIFNMLDVEPLAQIDFSPIHVGVEKKQNIPNAWRVWAASRLKETYHKVQQEFGERLPDAWEESLSYADDRVPRNVKWSAYSKEAGIKDAFV